MLNAFEPEKFHFNKINYNPHNIEFYEKNVEPHFGEVDFFRLSIFLSKDSSFVNIWFGLLDPFIVEEKIKEMDSTLMAQSFFQAEKLFSGYIDNNSEATVIMKSLRLDRFTFPQQIIVEKDNIICKALNKKSTP